MPIRYRTIRRRAGVVIATVVALAGTGVTIVGSGWLDNRDDPTSAPVATANPTVTGEALIGQELSCAPGTWERTPAEYTITWKTATRATVATGSPYTVAATDEGKKLRCEVTAANAIGSGKARSVLSATVAAANPLLIAQDSFTDTDAVLLQDHTGEVGATWTKHPSYTRDSQITLNRATSDGNSLRSRYYASGVPSGADYDVEAVVYWDSTIVGDRVDIYGRLSTTVDEGYQVRWNQPSGGWQLTKINATILTVLGSTYADMPANGSSRTVKLKMRGSTLKVYIDGTLRITQTDSSITAAGRAGIGERLSTATTGVHVDSFIATLPSPTEPDCANGADDDADTFVDLDDPGCTDENDTDETDEVPPPADPLCDDGIDNDSPADGLIDFPADPGCSDALDNDEYDEPPPPPPQTDLANVHIDLDGGTCARNTALSEYVDATACASGDAAYPVASCGDSVHFQPGSYAAQVIDVTAKVCTNPARVTFSPAVAASVTLASLTFTGASYSTASGFEITNQVTVKGEGGSGLDVTQVTVEDSPAPAEGGAGIRNVNIKGTYVTIQDNDIGDFYPCIDGGEDVIQITADAGVASSNVSIIGNYIHDSNRFLDGVSGATCAQHSDGVQSFGANNLTISRNYFDTMSTAYVIASPEQGAPHSGFIRIENNMTNPLANSGGQGFYLGELGEVCGDAQITFRYNTLQGKGLYIGCTDPSGDNEVYGNVFLSAPGTTACGNGNMNATISQNVFPVGQTGNCTTTTDAKLCDPTLLFPSSTSADWTLDSTDTCARGYGDQVNFPATDIAGNARPDGTVDAGASEIP